MFELYRPKGAREDPTSPHVVYPSSLFSLDLGYALWYPEPHEPTGQPQIGDVGYMRRGGFIRLFNINESRDEHAVGFWKPPFKPDSTPSPDVFILDKRDRPIAPGPYPSKGVRRVEIGGSVFAGLAEAEAGLSAGYTCKEAGGALLVLQSEASSESVFESRRLKEYMYRQHAAWSHYVRETLGHEVKEEDIVLVGGWVKTSADWAAMAFSNLVTKHYASVKGKAVGLFGLELFGTRAKDQAGPPALRQGTAYSENPGNQPANADRDQSVFLRRYKIKRRLVVLKTIVASAGYDRLPRGDDEGESQHGTRSAEEIIQADPSDNGLRFCELQISDPLDVILDYILEVSPANVAVAYDQDVESMLGDHEWPIDVSTFVRRVQPPVDVSDGYGSVSISRLLAREQYIQLEHRLINAADIREWKYITSDDAAAPAEARARFTDRHILRPFLPTTWRYLRFGGKTKTAIPSAPFSASRDGTLLASSLDGRSVVVWRLSDGLRVQRLAEDSHTKPITALDISPDNAFLVSGSKDATAIVWNLKTGEQIYKLAGHRCGIESITYSPDGMHIVASDDSSVKFWHAEEGGPMCTYPSSNFIRKLTFSPEGSRLAVTTDGSVMLFSTEHGAPIVRRTVLQFQQGAKVSGTTFSIDGRRLAVLARDGEGHGGHIYETEHGEAVGHFEPTSDVFHAAFDPDGTKLASASMDATAAIYDVETGAPCGDYDIAYPSVAVAYSADGRFFAAAGGMDEGMIRVWVRGTKELVVEFCWPASRIRDMEFLSDSRRLLTFDSDGEACLWDVGKTLRVR
ncbi:WD40 repeat domain-containing protein [Phanerochaete sordida]|uniref:WD40 repeat domain-containing protein n=1 Tax=Phanerochaete sordida TaxID=48140 RepID=A0A9P3LG78_9APHY|nr:WD40 repeat domain-containing protein [Phanerochaete sordida]